ncbi:MAG: hypothetical protein ACRD04_03470 [Terriglobales bacterium]
MAITCGRYLSATRAHIVYNLDHVCYYQTENDGKIKVHFSNGDSKDMEGEDARLFLAAVSQEPISPAQAA